MSENCSSVFRALLPVTRVRKNRSHVCLHFVMILKSAGGVFSWVLWALTKLQPVPVVSFELGDETQLPLGAQGVVEPQRPAQLAHAQVPLQGSGVLGEGEALLPLLPQWNRFTQTVDELK